MSIESNRAALAAAVESMNVPDLDAYMEIYDPDVVLHGYPPELPPGAVGARVFYEMVLAALLPADAEVQQTVAEGDRISAMFSLRGIHNGEFMGIPATGNEMELAGQTILRFDEQARIVERWQTADMLGLLQQLGVAPG